jgi:hypothetical protein
VVTKRKKYYRKIAETYKEGKAKQNRVTKVNIQNNRSWKKTCEGFQIKWQMKITFNGDFVIEETI